MNAIPQALRPDNSNPRHLSVDEVRLCQVAIFALDTLLSPDSNQSHEARCIAMAELVHSHDHFNPENINISCLIASLGSERSMLNRLIDRLEMLADPVTS